MTLCHNIYHTKVGSMDVINKKMEVERIIVYM